MSLHQNATIFIRQHLIFITIYTHIKLVGTVRYLTVYKTRLAILIYASSIILAIHFISALPGHSEQKINL